MANGLLDFISTPEGQGLLAATFGGLATARRGQPLNSIGRAGLAGLQGYGGAIERQKKDAVNQKRVDQENAAAKEKQRIEDLIRSNFMPVSGGNANAATGITGPRPEAAQAIGTKPAVDFQALIAQGVPFERVKQLAEAQNLGRNKVARTVKGMGPDGREFEYQVDEFGQRVGDGLAQYRAPIQVNQGDRQTFVDPYKLSQLGQFSINQSADSRASQATAIRGQNMTDARARESMNQSVIQGKTQLVNDPERGPMLVNMATGVSTPVVGRDGAQLPSASTAKQLAGTKKALTVIDEAEKIIDGATGSYAGAGIDLLASGVGIGTSGAKNIAKLKALEGALMMSQPRMEGPQSNMDVALYRQMAAQIGDPTVPNSVKKEALSTVRQLHERYASGGAPAPSEGQAFDSKPPAGQYKGKTMRGPDGKRYQSDGMIWKEVQ